MVEHVSDVLRLVWRTRFDDTTLGLNIDRFTVLRHAFSGLLQYPALFDRQMNLVRLNIRNLTTHWRGIDIQGLQNICGSINAKWASHQLKDVVATIDLNAQTTLKLFHIIVERPAQAHQTTVISRFKGDFTSFDIQTNPLGHSGPVMGCV